MTDQDDAADSQARDQQFVFEEFIRPRVERAERDYNRALTSLWLGNGAAALASLSFIGAAWRQGAFPHQLLLPLWFFVLGLVSMGIGSWVSLVGDARSIHSMQEADSVMELSLDDIQSTAERAGLTLKDWRTRMAVLSAFFFVGGCMLGLLQLTFQN